MNLSPDQKYQLNKILENRDNIVASLNDIAEILQQYFPDQFAIAYQHWIPQISTALKTSEKWLSRGQYSLQDTLDRINDVDAGSGVSKYIK